MEKKGISQEGLKLIACVTMLLDHIGAAFVSGYGLRIVGRIAFPIYCFLLAEGVAHTRSPLRYGLRLGIGAVLSEFPFDLLFFGGVTLAYQNVMITLLLGFAMAQWMQHSRLRILPALLSGAAAELLATDYGFIGVMMIWVFVFTREMHWKTPVQIAALGLLCWFSGSLKIPIGSVRIPIEVFALLAMIPIAFYSGRKRTRSKALQWGFYLFYPVHLTVLLLIRLFFQ